MKRMNAKIKLIVSSVCALLLFAACENIGNSSAPVEDEITGSISGSVSLDGALPSSIPALIPQNTDLENQSDARSAFPQTPVLTTSGYTLTITAANTKDSSDTRSINTTDNADCFSEDRLSYTISGLKINSSYKITASVTDSTGTEILRGTSASFTLTQTNSVCADADVALGPLSTGTGKVELSVSVDTELVKSIVIKIITNATNWPDAPENAQSMVNVLDSPFILLNKNSVPSGSYTFELKFYSASDGKGAVQYSTTQTINVFDGLTTNRWVNNSNEKEIAEGNLSVTAALISDFNKLVDFFVKSNGDDNNTGTWLKPLKTVGAALDRMTDSGADYTITIQDDLTGTYVLEMPATSRANSITIRGEGTVKLDGNGNTTNPVLKINTPSDVPVTIENLTITGGKATWGAGIYVEGRAKVTLGNRAVITGNSSSSSGSGVYVIGTNATTYPVVTILSGAKVNENLNSGTGSGICALTYGQVIMNGGELTGNSGGNGGAVHLYDHGQFTMNGGTISGNSAARGAAVFICLDCTFTMNGGIISGNSASTSGGAIYSNGTFNIKGDASIPYGVTNESGVLVKGAGKNDVYLAEEKFITVTDDLSQDVVAAVTTRWKRGDTILSSLDSATLPEAVKDKFTLTALADDRWGKYLSSDSKLVTINAPIYVGTKGSVSGNDDNSGTYTSPFATIARACQEMDDANTEYIVNVNGTVSGSQTIPSTLLAKSIILQGETSNSADIITAVKNGTSEGSTLTVNSTVPVTIKKLTITGGNSSGNGGGINIAAGSVCLSDGAKVTGNIAEDGYGGGVYVASSAKLFMCGSSLIGDSYTSTTTAIAAATSTNTTPWANKAEQGGGIYNAGAVYIGYSGMNGTTLVSSPMSSAYGVRRNYAGYGGGIYNDKGALKISGGNISYNQSSGEGGGLVCDGKTGSALNEFAGGTITGNVSGAGGGIMIPSTGKVTFTSSASVSMKSNSATNGGAVYNDGTFQMYSGTIGGTNVQNTATSEGKGGALYLTTSSSFEMKDSAYIPNGSVQNNDVFLEQIISSGTKTSAKINIAGSLSHTSSVAYLNPELYSRGFTVLSGTSTLIESERSKFTLPADWSSFEISNTGTIGLKNIITTIYVSSSGIDPSGKTSEDATWKKYNSTATYIKNYPFASLKKAAQFITWQGAENKDYTIYIVGSFTSPQRLSNDDSNDENPILLENTSSSTNTITIVGSSGTASINANIGNTAKADGSALTIKTNAVPVTVKNLKLTGGNSTGNGGGLNVVIEGSSNDKRTLTLGDGTSSNPLSVTENKGLNGGGVYVEAYTCTLNDYVSITSNTAVKSGDDTGDGGGVYAKTKFLYVKGGTIASNTAGGCGGGIFQGGGGLSSPQIFISGSACIGASSASESATSASNKHSNMAGSMGGGIYTGGKVYIGYTGLGTDSKPVLDSASTSSSHCKIFYNYAASHGGGVSATTYASKFSEISYNGSGDSGGGIHGEKLWLSGNIKFVKNKAKTSGGAVYAYSKMYIDGSVSVTYGGTEKYNDVCMKKSKPIIIYSTFTGSNIPVTPAPDDTHPAGKVILQGYDADDNEEAKAAIVKSKYKKFSVTTTGKYITSEGKFADGYYATSSNYTDVIANIPNDGLLVLDSSCSLSNVMSTINAQTKTIKLDISEVSFPSSYTITSTKISEITCDYSQLSSHERFQNCTSLYTINIRGEKIGYGVAPSGAGYGANCNNLFVACSSLGTVNFMNCTELKIDNCFSKPTSGAVSSMGLLVNLPETLTKLILPDLSTSDMSIRLDFQYYGNISDLKSNVTVTRAGTTQTLNSVTISCESVNAIWKPSSPSSTTGSWQ